MRKLKCREHEREARITKVNSRLLLVQSSCCAIAGITPVPSPVLDENFNNFFAETIERLIVLPIPNEKGVPAGYDMTDEFFQPSMYFFIDP